MLEENDNVLASSGSLIAQKLDGMVLKVTRGIFTSANVGATEVTTASFAINPMGGTVEVSLPTGNTVRVSGSTIGKWTLTKGQIITFEVTGTPSATDGTYTVTCKDNIRGTTKELGATYTKTYSFYRFWSWRIDRAWWETSWSL